MGPGLRIAGRKFWNGQLSRDFFSIDAAEKDRPLKTWSIQRAKTTGPPQATVHASSRG